MQIPIDPPEQYTITASVEELEGDESFSLGLIVGGHGVTVVIGGSSGKPSGLNLVDGQIVRSGPSIQPNAGLKGGLNTIRCEVSGNAFSVTCNGQQIIDWQDDPSRLSYGFEWEQGRPDVLKIGSWNTSCRISELVLHSPTS